MPVAPGALDPSRTVQDKVAVAAAVDDAVKKLEAWQAQKDVNASKGQAAKDKAVTAGKVKLAAQVLGKLFFVPGAGTLAKAIGGGAGLAKSNYACQACCFKFMGTLAGYAGPFQKWADLGQDIPGFTIFRAPTPWSKSTFTTTGSPR